MYSFTALVPEIVDVRRVIISGAWFSTVFPDKRNGGGGEGGQWREKKTYVFIFAREFPFDLGMGTRGKENTMSKQLCRALGALWCCLQGKKKIN